MTILHPFAATFFLIGMTGMVWRIITLLKMLSQVNKRLDSAEQISIFWAELSRFLRFGNIIDRFFANSSLLAKDTMATAVIIIGFVGFGITAFISPLSSGSR